MKTEKETPRDEEEAAEREREEAERQRRQRARDLKALTLDDAEQREKYDRIVDALTREICKRQTVPNPLLVSKVIRQGGSVDRMLRRGTNTVDSLSELADDDPGRLFREFVVVLKDGHGGLSAVPAPIARAVSDGGSRGSGSTGGGIAAETEVDGWVVIPSEAEKAAAADAAAAKPEKPAPDTAKPETKKTPEKGPVPGL